MLINPTRPILIEIALSVCVVCLSGRQGETKLVQVDGKAEVYQVLIVVCVSCDLCDLVFSLSAFLDILAYSAKQ